jgi:hypothetical protein
MVKWGDNHPRILKFSVVANAVYEIDKYTIRNKKNGEKLSIEATDTESYIQPDMDESQCAVLN